MSGECQHFRVAVGPAASRTHAAAALRPTLVVAGFGTALNLVFSRLPSISTNPRESGVVPEAAIFAVFALCSFAAGPIASLAGHRLTGVLGLAMAGVGSLLLTRTAGSRFLTLVPTAALILILGAALVHVSANLALTRADIPRNRRMRLDLAQGFFSAGAAAGPWMCGFLHINEGPGAELGISKVPYFAATAVFAAGAIVALSLHFRSNTANESGRGGNSLAFFSKFRVSTLQSAAIFCGIGAEMAMACLLVGFCMQPETGGMSLPVAAGYLPLYWAGIALGRLAGTAFLGILPAGRMVGSVAVSACLLVTASIGSSRSLAISSFMLAGTVISMLFPGLFSLALSGLSRVPGDGPGLLFPAMAGGGIVPIAEWALADRIGLHAALVIPAMCCLYLMFYGLVGPEEGIARPKPSERREAVCSIDSQRRMS